MHDLPFRYIREAYGVPAEKGRRVTIDGRPGVIVKDLGNYIGVHFDGDKPTQYFPCHPTWKVEYLGMGEIPKLTRGQKTYQDYLDVADCFESFMDYLKYLSKKKKSCECIL